MCSGAVLADVPPSWRRRLILAGRLPPEGKKILTPRAGSQKRARDEEDFEAALAKFEVEPEIESEDEAHLFTTKESVIAKVAVDVDVTDATKKNKQFRGICRSLWGKWAAEIRDPSKGVRVLLGTYNSPEEATKAYDAEAHKIHGKKAKVNFPDDAAVASKKNLPEARPTKVAKKNTGEKQIVNNMTNPNLEPFMPNEEMSFASLVNDGASIQKTLLNMSSDQGSNSLSSSHKSLQNGTSDTDITSVVAHVPTMKEVDEPAFLQDTANAPAALVIGDASVAHYELYMNILMDRSDESINTFLVCEDELEDVGSNMNLWNFDDMPMSGDIAF